MSQPQLRHQVKQLYKTLLFLGREWPKGYTYFRDRCHGAFLKNKDIQEPEEIQKIIHHGEFVVKEIQALYYLKKYRTLKRRYYDAPTSDSFQNFEAKYTNGEPNP